MTRHVDYPLHFDGRGHTAETGPEEHVRDLVEQLLFTTPGERVNRPTFGSGLLGLVFEPGGDALADATQLAVQGALQAWLAEEVVVEAVEVEAVESRLDVTVQYVVRRTEERRRERFAREAAR